MNFLYDKLAELGLNAILLVHDSNIRYLTGYTGTDSFVLAFKDQTYLITDYRYREQAERECPGIEVVEVNREVESHEAVIASIMMSHEASKVAFESNYAKYAMIKTIRERLFDTDLIATEGIVEGFRRVKTSNEIDCIRTAAAIADKAFSNVLDLIKIGVTERELAWVLESELRSNGSQGTAFPMIMLFGQNTSQPHGIPSDKKLETGDLITMDFGAEFNGYRSDMTRTLVVGKPNEKQEEIYCLVKESLAIGLKNIKVGATGREVNESVNQWFEQHKMTDFCGKGLGHGVGLDIHEKPFMNKACHEMLRENYVVTVEPGIYIPFWGGIRIEDLVVVTQSGCEILTHSSKELIII